MTNEDTSPGIKRFRSPPYPAVNLGEAVTRADQLYSVASHHPVGWNVLASAWDYKQGSGSLGAAAAALIQFGLLADDGTGDKRKFTLTDAAIRILRDADPNSEKRREAIKRAALTPKIYQEIWEKFSDTAGVSDVVLQNYLTFDRKDEGKAPYGFDAAQAVITGFKETIDFAQVAKSATVAKPSEDKGGAGDSKVDLRKLPTLDPNPAKGREFGKPEVPRMTSQSEAVTGNPIEVFMAGGRLQIAANVDAAGLQTLKTMLSKYEEILNILAQQVGSAPRPHEDEADETS